MNGKTERNGRADDAGRLVMVIGMQRSGTSAVAEAIVRLGVPAGGVSRLHEPDKWNPHGCFEDVEVNLTNDAILKELGGELHVPPAVVGQKGDLPSALLDRMRKCVEEATDDGRGHVWKDPRLSITLPYWRPLIRDPVVIIVWRHPWEVAQSLLTRARFPPAVSCALWEVYTRCAITNSADVPRLLLGYAEFVRSPVPVLQRLQAMLLELGVVRNPGSVQRAVEAIDPELRHHKCDAQTEGAPMLTRSQVRLLESLRRREIPELDYAIEPWNMLLVEHRRLAAERDDLERRLVHVSNEKQIYEDSYRYIMNKPCVRAYRTLKGFLRSLLGRRGGGRPGGET